MYYYIVDPQNLSQKEFERVQNDLYSSLSELRISGEVVRITGLRTPQQLVENAFAHEAKTIVAVGGDDTLHSIINAIGRREIVVGFIPIIESEMAEIFGIKDPLQAVKTIAARRIELVDLGVINDNDYFLSKATLEIDRQTHFELNFQADEKYQAHQITTSVLIINSRKQIEENKIGNPTDGLLDVLLLPQLNTWNKWMHRRQILAGFYESISLTSVLHVKEIAINHPGGMALKVGDKTITKTPAKISIEPKALKLIVGKDRSF